MVRIKKPAKAKATGQELGAGAIMMRAAAILMAMCAAASAAPATCYRDNDEGHLRLMTLRREVSRNRNHKRSKKWRHAEVS